jgi:hypothetical protein
MKDFDGKILMAASEASLNLLIMIPWSLECGLMGWKGAAKPPFPQALQAVSDG